MCDYKFKELEEIERLKAQVFNLITALNHAVEIAEGKTTGTWDDLLQYRALITKIEAKKATTTTLEVETI